MSFGNDRGHVVVKIPIARWGYRLTATAGGGGRNAENDTREGRLMERCHTINRRHALGLTAAAAVGAAGGLSLPAFGQAKTLFKASDVHPTGYPTVAAVENLGKKLEAATNGRFGVQMFASMQLGGEKEAIEQAQVGAIQFARVSVGTLGPVVDDVNVMNMPFVFRNTAHMQKVIDGPVGQDLLDRVTGNTKAGLVGICWMDAGSRSVYTTKKPVHSIDDLKGLKIRVIGNPMFVDMMNALGGNGVAMGYDQVFSALQTGVIDGAENNPPSYVFDNHYTVAKHYSLTEHLIVPEMLIFSKKTWDALSKDDQALLTKFGREAQAEERELWTKYEKSAMDKARAAGVEIIEIADKKPFQDAVKPVWDKYGPKYADLIKSIQAVT
jgi:tripartite ATP-independent transporter DctP family solute receptor